MLLIITIGGMRWFCFTNVKLKNLTIMIAETYQIGTAKLAYDRLLASVFIHRNTGEKLRIKKLHGSIVTCESEITRVITENPYLATNTVICKLENLELCTK